MFFRRLMTCVVTKLYDVYEGVRIGDFMERLYVEQFQKMFICGADLIIEKEPYLTEIDSVIGDGDHGIGMKRGCEALKKLLENKKYSYVDDLCYGVSTELIKTMGGASGIIFGTMFFGGLSRLSHREYAEARELSGYFMEGEQSIERRGKARPGQKTMLDALYPACIAMEHAADQSADVVFLFKAGYEAAAQGAEDSRMLKSRMGRSKNFKEKTLGLPDPGAVSASLWFQAFYETVVRWEKEPDGTLHVSED